MSTHSWERFVAHPRYGLRPRVTGLNPAPDTLGAVVLHWHSPEQVRIPHTAIAADLSRQTPATVPVTHYFDVKRQCRDCGRPFIFFAEEQKHWYEELGFVLDADCVRCVECRQAQRGLDRQRQRYEELFHVPGRTVLEDLEFVECSLSLVEAGHFHARQLERVRRTLKRVSPDEGDEVRVRVDEARARLRRLEGAERSG